jgi:formate/nitrite transporter FocA (FNT family)
MLKRFFAEILNGVLAILSVGIGCIVFLSCDNVYVGAILFSVALLTVCIMKFSLFTGKIGYIVENFNKEHFLLCLACLIGNVVGALVIGTIAKLGLPELEIKAGMLIAGKLTQTPIQTIIRALFCGVIIHIAVHMYNHKDSLAGIILGIPTFILSGFEHSIADMFYFALTGRVLEAIPALLLITLGNAIGGNLIPLVQKLTKQ